MDQNPQNGTSRLVNWNASKFIEIHGKLPPENFHIELNNVDRYNTWSLVFSLAVHHQLLMPPLLSYGFSVFLIPRIEICREPAISIHIWFNSSHGELTLECDRDSRGVSREETERNSENGRDMLEIDVKKGNVDEHECYAEKN